SLATRVWARLVTGSTNTYLTTSYTYDDDTGELLTVSYNDSATATPTPGITYTYARLGRVATVVDAATGSTGTRTFVYDDTSTPPTFVLKTETLSGGMFDGKVITQTYQSSGSGNVPGRWNGVEVGTSSNATAYYASSYDYDGYGRLNYVSGS